MSSVASASTALGSQAAMIDLTEEEDAPTAPTASTATEPAAPASGSEYDPTSDLDESEHDSSGE